MRAHAQGIQWDVVARRGYAPPYLPTLKKAPAAVPPTIAPAAPARTTNSTQAGDSSSSTTTAAALGRTSNGAPAAPARASASPRATASPPTSHGGAGSSNGGGLPPRAPRSSACGRARLLPQGPRGGRVDSGAADEEMAALASCYDCFTADHYKPRHIFVLGEEDQSLFEAF